MNHTNEVSSIIINLCISEVLTSWKLENESQTTLTAEEKDAREPASHTNTPITGDPPFSASLLAPSQDDYRVSKRRRPHLRKKTAGLKKPIAVPAGIDKSQLTEDDLFQLFITRIRQREEDAVASATLRKQLEDVACKLTDENQALNTELEAYSVQLQKKTMEAKSYRSQIDDWKAKIGKFKHFLNMLGTDYQNLRGESIHLRAARSALDKEGKELRGNIDDIKAQISQVVRTVGEKKGHLMESETILTTLGSELKHSEEKTKLVQTQLIEERRRVVTLESYIQRHSYSQERELGLIRSDQLGISEKLNSAFEAMARLWESSQASLRSILSPTMDKCLLALSSITEKDFMDKLEIQKFADIISGFITR